MLQAFGEARRLGHQWVGPGHVLLAILNREESSLATEVLGDLTGASYEQHFLRSLLHGSPPVRSDIETGAVASPAPIYYRIDGWVTGRDAPIVALGIARQARLSVRVGIRGLLCRRPTVDTARSSRSDIGRATVIRRVTQPLLVPGQTWEPAGIDRSNSVALRSVSASRVVATLRRPTRHTAGLLRQSGQVRRFRGCRRAVRSLPRL
jgi:hypothetical protein